MMQMVKELLRGSFWRLDLSKVSLSRLELEFLSNFFNITYDKEIDDFSMEEKRYLILRKKQKYISNPLVN